jgi:hypothetical protein
MQFSDLKGAPRKGFNPNSHVLTITRLRQFQCEKYPIDGNRARTTLNFVCPLPVRTGTQIGSQIDNTTLPCDQEKNSDCRGERHGP